MSLPEESVAANTLPEVTTIPTGKKLIFTDPDTNEGGIITLENLSKQILQNLTSQTFTLDQGNLTLLQALNQLNSKRTIFINEANNDFEWAKNYWYTIQGNSCVKFVYNSNGSEFFYIFVKRANAHGFVLRCGYSTPQIEMIRFTRTQCMNKEFDVIK